MKRSASSPARLKVRLGGDSGTVVDLHAGDVAVIPAGVAHKGEAASPDLLIVGAYPGGRGPDMRIPGKGDREQALENIAAVPPPATDPVCGRSGPLIERRRRGDEAGAKHGPCRMEVAHQAALALKRVFLGGTEGSNPLSSSGESIANLIFGDESHRWPAGNRSGPRPAAVRRS